MFSLLNGSADKYLSVLSGGENFAKVSNFGKVEWDPFTPEVIPFHEWFTGKMKKQLAVGKVKGIEVEFQ